MRPMWLGHHPLYTGGLHPDARFPRARYDLTVAALRTRDVHGRLCIEAPAPASRDALVLVHDAAFVDAFLGGALPPDAIRRIGLRPWTDGIVPRTLALVGGTLTALREAVDTGGYAGNLAGGTHHAFRDHGSGYCIVNDLAVAARVAQRDHGVGRVLVLDLDVHQGDGTAALFADDPSVVTVSVHGAGNFPFTKQRSDFDLELPDGTTDGPYLDAVARALEVGMAARPELVLYQGGVDPLAEDKLGRLAVSREGLQARNAAVFDAIDAAGLPAVVLMGGGYGRPLEATVDALADLFLAAADRHAGRAVAAG
jgi:acetoin utilization deacetylase AcuC-like enzyme